MTTPNTSISSLGIGDVNSELNFSANTMRRFNDGIFRNLTGSQQRTVSNTTINISDLSGKTAFGGIISANSSNVTSYGVIEREINLLANTDMYSPTIVWTANLISGVAGVFTFNGKQASYKITGQQEANVTANVEITATLSYAGHEIGVASKYISFEINSLPPLLFVNGNTSANSITYEPTSISTTLTATANAPGSVIQFSVTPNDSGVLISGNTVTLSSQAGLVGTDNNRSYSVFSELIFDGQIIATDLKNVNVRAFYQVPDFIFTVPATSNNNFANTGTIHSSLTLTTSHDIPSANMEWSATKVSGDDAVLTVDPGLASANLHVNVASGTFTTKKSVYDVVATLKYSNGQIITSKTQRLTLRTGAYGLTFTPSANVVASGYTAQTAIAISTATYLAGTFAWNIAKVAGNNATITPTVVAGSATANVSLPISSVGTSTATYRINPTLVFDGVVMANIASQVLLTSQQNAYSFSLSGPTSNTQLGDAPVSAVIVTTASHDVAGGGVEWEKTTSPTILDTNGLEATTTYTNNTIGSDTFVLGAILKDDQNRTIETKTRTLTHRAYYPNIGWSGSNNVVNIGYTNQVATAAVNATARAGANTLVVTSAKLTGSDLTFNTVSGNSSIRTVNLTASQNDIGTKEGLYRLTANVTWFGVSNTSTYDVSVSATKEDAGFTLEGTGESKNSFNFPVVSNGSFVASHVIPSGTITWSRVINSGTVSSTPVSNATNYVFRTSQSAVGTASANVTVTATLRDQSGALVEAKSNTVSTSSTVNNPTLALNGPASNTVSNTFHAEASIVLTPSVSASLTGHTYSFSWVTVSGSATVSSNSSAVLLTNTYDGAGSVAGTFDVTCNVIKSGQTIATITRRVTVTATCPAPTYNFTDTDDSKGSFNFPVNSYAKAEASSSPAGAVITWTWTKVSGQTANLYTEASNSRFVVNCQQSTVGTVSSVYDVTATYRTPNGTLLATRTGRLTATSQRYNPALTWNYSGGSNGSNSVTGFAENLSTVVSLAATSNASMTGETYRITSTQVSGNKTGVVATSNSSGTASVTLSNNRTSNGTNQKTAVYDVFIDVLLNSQVITGQVTRRVTLTVTPGTVQDVGAINVVQYLNSGSAFASMTFSTNGAVTTSVGSEGNWMTNGSVSEAANYEINFGTGWLSLSQSRTLSATATSNGNDGGAQEIKSGTYQIRHASTLVVLGSASYYLEASSGIEPV